MLTGGNGMTEIYEGVPDVVQKTMGLRPVREER
jgi:hypothetical protein